MAQKETNYVKLDNLPNPILTKSSGLKEKVLAQPKSLGSNLRLLGPEAQIIRQWMI